MAAAPELQFSDEPLTEPTPIAPASSDTTPKRRGRPPGSKNRTGGTDTRVRRNSAAWIRQQCAGVVGAANLGLALSPLADDALTDEEADLLTDALAAEAAQSERILKWMEKAGAISPHLLMLKAVVTIATPRLVRHGVIKGATPSDATFIAALRQQGYNDAEISEWFRTQFGREPIANAPVPVATG